MGNIEGRPLLRDAGQEVLPAALTDDQELLDAIWIGFMQAQDNMRQWIALLERIRIRRAA